MIDRNVDILVVGTGQAGLAMGYHLKQAGYRFQLVDRNARMGDSWRNRYDSLLLFTPRAYSALPGLPVPGDPDGYPTKDEIADYLEQYAAHFDLPLAMRTGIRSLTRHDGGFQAMTDTAAIVATRTVVLATGAFQCPAVPPIARQFAPDVLQLTAESYKNSTQVPPVRVLVVGDGATGRHLAVELMATHEVVLATGRPRRASPEHILARASSGGWTDWVSSARHARAALVATSWPPTPFLVRRSISRGCAGGASRWSAAWSRSPGNRSASPAARRLRSMR
jgi:putative flavoprotein involved in K+ transport